MQEHHATALHWDVRFEHDGVAPSWAVPKGLPRDPATNHLAVHTEDHPIEYLDFEGQIPEGEYGAGSMHIWDRGTYDLEEWGERKLKVVLHGARVRGRYAFFATGGRGGRDWMVHRMDPPDEVWAPRPDELPVVEAEPGPLPTGGRWVAEPWWPGHHVRLAVAGGRVVGPRAALHTQVPELRRLAEGFGSTEVLLDGVLVVVGADGRPDPALAERRATATGVAARRLAAAAPALYVVADLLWHDGEPLADVALEERRARLDAVLPRGPAARVTPQVGSEGAPDLLAAAAGQGLRGVITKPFGSPYGPGAGWVAVSP